MYSIAIIGGGLSGTLLAMNLLRQPGTGPLELVWIDRNGEHTLGPAYSTKEGYLLNVPVEKMGVYPDDPGHFLTWAERNGLDVREGDYLPRKVYREYVLGEYDNALSQKMKNRNVRRIKDEAVDLRPDGKKVSVTARNSGDFSVDRVVLALGNPPPKNPPGLTESCLKSSGYIADPWDPNVLDALDPEGSVLFIGSGQTTVDLITGLYNRGHAGKMIALSRKGLLPMSHKKGPVYPSFYSEIEGETSVLSIYRTIRKHVEAAIGNGSDPRAVIDSLRPHTIDIWMVLPVEEKKRFLRHLFRYWERIRSRIPPVSMDVVQELIHSRQLEVISGRIFQIEAGPEILRVSYRDRATQQKRVIGVRYVINCMGSNADFSTVKQELIKNLLKRKLIRCAPSGLGMDALPEGNVLDADGTPSPVIYTIGPAMKGVVWESIATPEIRVQAENLAVRLLD